MNMAGPQNWFLTLSFCCPSPLSEQCPTYTGAGEELLTLMAALSPSRHTQFSVDCEGTWVGDHLCPFSPVLTLGYLLSPAGAG